MSQAVKLSARKVQELLAGKITAEQLFSDYQHRHSKFESPFQPDRPTLSTSKPCRIRQVYLGVARREKLFDVHGCSNRY